MGSDIRVVAFLKVRPGTHKAIEAAVRDCTLSSRDEGGRLMYAGHWDQADENRLVFVEHWTSQAALDEHMTTKHFHAYISAIDALLEGAPEVIILREIRWLSSKR
jgi:quinol monooxygenase YgiN